MQNRVIHDLHHGLQGNCKVTEFLAFVTISEFCCTGLELVICGISPNTRTTLEEVPSIVARCTVTHYSYYTNSFCTYIDEYILAYGNL